MNIDSFIFALEMIGTVAFAISGVMVAKEREMDLFGAETLGCCTAVGGGVIRDVLLGRIPPVMFQRPIYILVAAVTCLLAFAAARHNLGEKIFSRIGRSREWSGALLSIADSIGLAAFVVVGCRSSVNAGYGENLFLSAFVGTVTGIGGGILRDMLAGQMPLIMRKRVYGMAAIAGAAVYCLMQERVGPGLSAGVSMAVTVLIRFLAIHYRWNLPSFKRNA